MHAHNTTHTHTSVPILLYLWLSFLFNEFDDTLLQQHHRVIVYATETIAIQHRVLAITVKDM